jgi:hypothetical protein
MLVPSGYVHDLHRRRRLLIRSRGVTSSDEDAQIAMLLDQDHTEEQLPPPPSIGPHSPPQPLSTSAKRRFMELEPAVPAKRRLTKLNDIQHPIKQEKLKNDVIEIDSSDEEDTVQKRKATGKGRRVDEVIIVDDEDDNTLFYQSMASSSSRSTPSLSTSSSSLRSLSLSPQFPFALMPVASSSKHT